MRLSVDQWVLPSHSGGWVEVIETVLDTGMRWWVVLWSKDEQKKTITLKIAEQLRNNEVSVSAAVLEAINSDLFAVAITISGETISLEGNGGVGFVKRGELWGKFFSGSFQGRRIGGQIYDKDQYLLFTCKDEEIPLGVDELFAEPNDTFPRHLETLFPKERGVGVLRIAAHAKGLVRWPSLYLPPDQSRERRVIIFALVVLALLFVSIFAGWKRRETAERAELYQGTHTSIRELITESGRVVAVDRAQAKRLIAEAEEKLAEVTQQFDKQPDYAEKLKQLALEISQAKEQVTGEMAVGDLPVWFDLRLIRDGFRGAAMTVGGKHLAVLDSQGTIAKITVPEKQARLVGSTQVERTLIASDEKRALVVSRGVKSFAEGIEPQQVAPPDALLNPVGMGLFGGNLYIADQGAESIFRFQADGAGGLREKQAWLGEGV